MGDTKAKFTDTRTGFIDILMCRYEDEHLALWMKIVFCFIWIISIPNGLIYGVDTDYIIFIAMSSKHLLELIASNESAALISLQYPESYHL